MKRNTIIIIAIALLFSENLTAQIGDLNQKIPVDPSVKIGKLDNGLTYYIKQNPKPKNKAELRLVIKAGSILEDEDQLGLAHFVEHMAFNGTKRFEKNKLVDYLQNLGIEFGADLNANTGFDRTMYQLPIPIIDKKVLNTGLQILRDWADGITFEDKQIDEERGIIAEEKRARGGAGMRMFHKMLPAMTNNSRYSERIPIGTLDVIMNSKYDVMKRFYRDWYRPDLMALVLVGDFDVAETEKKVKELFSSMKVVKNPRKREYYKIAENKDPVVVIAKDKEYTNVDVSIYTKKEEVKVKTLKDYRQAILRLLYTGMLRKRFREIETQPNAPFFKASAKIGQFLGNMDSYTLKASLKEDKVTEGIEMLLTESERAKKYGFTNPELERYKSVLLNQADIRQKEAGKMPSRSYVNKYISNFINENPIPSDAFLYKFYKKILPTITVDEVNRVADQWVRKDNVGVVLKAVDKQGLNLPTEKKIKNMLKRVRSKNIEPYKDKLGDIKLMENPPKPGKIISETYNEKVNVTTWKMRNGVTVIAKPTKLQNDLITMSGFRPGGISLAPDAKFVSARHVAIIGSSGVNGISSTNLQSLNMGKTVSVQPRISYHDEAFVGTSSSEYLERMLQMIYLYATKPNKDKDVFNSGKERLKMLARNKDKRPIVYFQNKVSEYMTNNHLRYVSLSEEKIEKELNLDEMYDFYKQRFSSANGFTFVFVGSFDLEKLKAYATQYLGGLPSNLKEKSIWKDNGMRYTKGVIKKKIVKGIGDKSKVEIRFSGTLDFSLEERNKLELMSNLLRIKLIEELREKMRGVYSVSVSGYASDKPYDWYRLSVEFSCDPDNAKKLIAKTLEEIEKIKKQGATQENIRKIKEAELANTKEKLESNNYWKMELAEAYKYGLNPESILDYKTEINKIDSKMFKSTANKYFDLKNYAEFILVPEKKPENK